MERRYREVLERGVLDLWGPLAHSGTLHGVAEHLLELGRSQLDGRLEPGALTAALCPHGALNATGLTSARAYAGLSESHWPDVFVIIGSSHYTNTPVALSADVSTALGTIETDRGLLHALLADPGAADPVFHLDDPVLLVEHSWKQDLPLLQTLALRFRKPLRILALVAGGLDFRQAGRLGRRLAETLLERRQRGCLIASGDLSHVGHGYRWRPDWLQTDGSVGAVIDQLERFERPILDAVAALDIDAVEAALPSTGFCARNHLATLMEFATTTGLYLGTETVLNDERVHTPPDRAWQDDDKLFRGAAIAFMLPTAQGATALCAQTLSVRREQELVLVHRCTNESMALPMDAADLVDTLRRGAHNRAELIRRAARDNPDFSQEAVRGVIQTLDAEQWLHHAGNQGPPAHATARAREMLAYCRESIPYYRGLPSNDLRRAPFLRSEQVRRHWRDFLPADAPETFTTDRYFVRRSSGSSGEGLLSVEELPVVAKRNLAVAVVGERDHRRMLSLNRPDNLHTPRDGDWPRCTIDKDGHSQVSPGPCPTQVDDATWDRVIATAVELQPRFLEGDPAYLHAFALRCRALGMRLPGLERIVLGHSYAWTLYRKTLEDVFRVPVHGRLITSEVGDVTAVCPLGREHLVESRVLYELRRRGRGVRPGGFGVLALTTLDSTLRPLVRYLNGDLLRLRAERCACGRPFRVVSYEGRVSQLFAASRGRPITLRRLDEAIGAPAGIRFFRLHVEPGSITLELVPIGDPALVDTHALCRRLAALTGRSPVVRWSDALESQGGKPNAVLTPDKSDHWYAYFLGPQGRDRA